MSVCIGISLGSESCMLAVSSAPGRQEVVADDMGERATPFFVAYRPEEVLIGSAARNASVRYPRNTVHGILALLSAKNTDDTRPYKLTCEVDDVQPEEGADADAAEAEADRGVVLPSVADWGDEDAKDTDRTPEDVALEFFTRLKTLIVNAAGQQPVGTFVVAVPRGTDAQAVLDVLHRAQIVDAAATVRVLFDDACVAALGAPATCLSAAALSGASSPTVSAASCPPLPTGGASASDATPATLIVDWGANALRASVVRHFGGALDVVGTAASVGKVGGRQLDKALADQVATAFQRKTRCDPRDDSRAMRKLVLACASAKSTLSVSANTSIELEAFCNGVDLAEPVSRMKLEMAFDSLGGAAVLDGVLASALEAARQAVPNLQVVRYVLVGGMNRVPRAQATVRAAITKHAPAATASAERAGPDEAAALGACLAAQSLPASRRSWAAGDLRSDSVVLPARLVTAGGDDSTPVVELAAAGTPLPLRIPIKLGSAASAELALPLGFAPASVITSDVPASSEVTWFAVATVPAGARLVQISVSASGDVTVSAGTSAGKLKEILSCPASE